MDNYLLNILACPICFHRLIFNSIKNELICNNDKIIWPIINEIPNLLKINN
ncbi:Trm112 family protein [Buchnera aphidicola (Neophyllaphis podocarpi)]|uniref:Trm112 family protein n=1 Tax=Buchnera aphidicola TaxID=9 RepID=UPI0031B89089